MTSPGSRAGSNARRRKWQRFRQGLGLLPLVAPIFAYGVPIIVCGGQIARELERIRAEGAPVTLAEVAPPPVPEAQNAAPIYARAVRTLPSLKRPYSGSLSLAKTDEDVLYGLFRDDPVRRLCASPRRLRRVLMGTERSLHLARHAASMPRCRFPIDWEAGHASFADLSRLRPLMHLLGAHAILCARDGRAAEAAADLEAMVGLSDHVGAEPAGVGQAIQYTFLSLAARALEQVTADSTPEENTCRRMEKRLVGLDVYDRFLRSMEVDRCTGLWMFDALERDHLFWADVMHADPKKTSRAEHAAKMLALKPVATWDRMTYLRAIRRQIDQAREARPIVPDEPITQERPATFAFISRMLLPPMDPFSPVGKRDVAIARIALMRAALGLEIYRARTGRYPVSLEEAGRRLGRALPHDPFVSAALRYRRQGTGYLLYSVGANRRDEKGRKPDQIKGPVSSYLFATADPPDDVVFSVGQ